MTRAAILSLTLVVAALWIDPGFVDGQSAKVYWTDYSDRVIEWADPDGQRRQTVVATIGPAAAVAVDSRGGKIYWSEETSIWRADLKGNDKQLLISTGLVQCLGLAVDNAGGKIYWTDAGNGTIRRADLDGGNRQILISTGLSQTTDIALDLESQKLYWTDRQLNTVSRANLDGSSIQILRSGEWFPLGIDLNLLQNRIYWANSDNPGEIRRSSLNGHSPEDVVSVPGAAHLELDPVAGKIYWTNGATGEISRCNLNGSGIEVLATGVAYGWGISLLDASIFADGFESGDINAWTASQP